MGKSSYHVWVPPLPGMPTPGAHFEVPKEVYVRVRQLEHGPERERKRCAEWCEEMANKASKMGLHEHANVWETAAFGIRAMDDS